MKNLLVVFNESVEDNVFKEKNAKLIETAKKMNINLDFKSNSSIYTYLNVNSVKSFGANLNYDFCLFFDHDAYLAKSLEMLGIRVINNSRAFLLCENKANMYQEMIANRISIPKTFILPTQNNYTREGIADFVNEAIVELSFPIVLKKFFGSTGEGVFLVKNKDELWAVIDKFKGKKILMQEFIAESAGTDIRVLVIKDKVVCALRRMASAGFRSNATLGGTLAPYTPTIVETKLALSATQAMNCNYAVVDMLKSVTGSLVCEVNATANLANFEKVTGANVFETLIKNCLLKK